MLNLDELERLADAATPGPWGFDSYSTVEVPPDDDETAHHIAFVPRIAGDTATPEGRLNAAYIAAADPSTVKALIAEIYELRFSLGRYTDRKVGK